MTLRVKIFEDGIYQMGWDSQSQADAMSGIQKMYPVEWKYHCMGDKVGFYCTFQSLKATATELNDWWIEEHTGEYEHDLHIVVTNGSEEYEAVSYASAERLVKKLNSVDKIEV